MSEFHIMIGTPGSGKSTRAEALVALGHVDTRVVTDDIRARRIKRRNNPDDDPDFVPEIEPQVWEEARTTLRRVLRAGQVPLLDSTNTDPEKRAEWLAMAQTFKRTPVAHVLYVPYHECLRRNQERDRYVPEDVIERFYKELVAYCQVDQLTDEGWKVWAYVLADDGGLDLQ